MNTQVQVTSTHIASPLEAQDAAHSIFDIFGLARELRDMIYDEMLEDSSEQSKNYIITRKNSANPKLLTLSRTFRAEYQEAADRHSSVTITKTARQPLHKRLRLAPSLRTTSTLQINVFHNACEGDNCLRIQETIRQMPKVTDLTIKSIMRGMSSPDAIIKASFFASVNHVKKVSYEVCDCKWLYLPAAGSDNFEELGKWRPFWRWTKEGAVVENFSKNFCPSPMLPSSRAEFDAGFEYLQELRRRKDKSA